MIHFGWCVILPSKISVRILLPSLVDCAKCSAPNGKKSSRVSAAAQHDTVPVLSPLPQLRYHPWWPDSDWQLQGRPARCLWCICWSHQWRNHILAGLGPCPWKTETVSWAWWEGGRLFQECTQAYFITWPYTKHVAGKQQGQKLTLFYLQDFDVCTEYSAYFHTHTSTSPLNKKKIVASEDKCKFHLFGMARLAP